MGQFVLDYPDGQGTRILNGLCHKNGWDYEANKLEGPPVETKQQFVKRKIAEIVKGIIGTSEATLAGNTAYDAARQDVRDNVNIT